MPKLSKLLNFAGLAFIAILLLLSIVSFSRKSIYQVGQGMNVLMITEEAMGIVSVRPSRDMAEVTKLPENLMVAIEPSGGDYLIEAIYKIGLPLKNQLEIARISVGQDLGVVLAGVVRADADLSVAGLREALLSLAVRTNLSITDRYRMVKDLTNILGKGSTFSSSIPSNVLDSSEEPDGKRILRLNPAIYVWSRNKWVNDEVLSETAELTVVNGSGTEGKARIIARQIETAGGRVIDVISSKKTIDGNCFLFGNAKEHPQTASFIASSFLCKEASDITLSEFIETDVKSDLVMIVGKDY